MIYISGCTREDQARTGCHLVTRPLVLIAFVHLWYICVPYPGFGTWTCAPVVHLCAILRFCSMILCTQYLWIFLMMVLYALHQMDCMVSNMIKLIQEFLSWINRILHDGS